jgi:hypothetical protein
MDASRVLPDMTVGQPYRIIVDGELGGWLSHHVGAATIEAANGVTTITGVLDGPMELQTLTETLCDLGLAIESARLL